MKTNKECEGCRFYKILKHNYYDGWCDKIKRHRPLDGYCNLWEEDHETSI